MDQETIGTIVRALKQERIDLVVTLPEEPTSPLIAAIRQDRHFTSVLGSSLPLESND
jgi:hypothetical protein